MIDLLPVFGGMRGLLPAFRLYFGWEGERPRFVLLLHVGVLKCQLLRDVNAEYIRLFRIWLILF